MIADDSIAKYLDDLASGAPTPGGGAAAALTLAQAAALISMVCNFTVGREKYKAVEPQVQAILDQANAIRSFALTAADRDVAAYAQVAVAYKLPAQDPAKAATIQSALASASKVPASLIEPCETLQAKATELRPICNQNLVSDVDVALSLVQGAVGALRALLG